MPIAPCRATHAHRAAVVRAHRRARRRQSFGDPGEHHGEPAGEIGAGGVVAPAVGIAHALADVGHPAGDVEIEVGDVGVDQRAVRNPDRRGERRIGQLDRRGLQIGRDLAEPHRLEVAALAAGRDPQDREPRRDVLGRHVVAAGAGAAALEQVAREEPDVGAQLRDVERRRLGPRGAGLPGAGAARPEEDDEEDDQEVRALHGRIVASARPRGGSPRGKLARRRPPPAAASPCYGPAG